MKIAVIGGGAAGLMAAAIASEKHNITLFERQSRVGKKLFASGNGRCNMTNSALTRDNLKLPNNFYNCARAAEIVSRFDYDDFMDYCHNVLGIETFADEQGRVYPRSENGGSVLDAFRLRCIKNKVKICDETFIMKVEKRSKDFKVWLGDGQFYFYDRVIFAVGSNIQIRNFTGFEMLRDFEIDITKTQTSLTPIKTKKVWLPLNGTKVKCRASLLADGVKVMSEEGEVLFRDYGLSGIAVFNLSSYIARDIVKGKSAEYTVSLDLFPELTVDELHKKLAGRVEICGKETKTFFVGMLCNKLADSLIKSCKLGEKLSADDFKTLASYMKDIRFDVLELCGTEKGQVMCGGIDFDEVDENMQSKKVSGLYFVGECMDADGICGGFNLHFAFASGYLAAKSI